MHKTRRYAALVLPFVLLLSFFLIYAPTGNTSVTETPDPATEDVTPTSTDSVLSEETVPISAQSRCGSDPSPKYGLVRECGSFYFYTTYGTRFTGGIQEVTSETGTDYYYFLSNGQGFTSGYKEVVVDDIPCYYYFQRNGKAFTGGLKKIFFGTQAYLYYFGEDGKAVTSDWVVLGEDVYYFDEKGRAVQDSFLTLDENRYYFDEIGRIVTGWFCLEEDFYYYAYANGVIATDTVVDQYRLDKDGRCYTKYRILQYVRELTDSSMTEQEKIDALYNWLLPGYIYYFNSYEHIQADWHWPAGWIDDFAKDMMDDQRGNCFKYAAFLGLMIREATGLPVTVYRGTLPLGDPHGWVTVYQDGDWFIYDIQQAIQGEDPAVCYKVPYPLERLIGGVGTALQ